MISDPISTAIELLINEVQRLEALNDDLELTVCGLQAEKDYIIRQHEKEKEDLVRQLANDKKLLQVRERAIRASKRSLREQNGLSVYVLKLEKGKYYIGKTSKDVEVRFREHLDPQMRTSSSWTQMYRPERILAIYPHSEDSDENKVTKEWMRLKGIENVRGGLYTQLELSEEVVNQIELEFKGDYDECFVCGGTDHFAGSCNVSSLPDVIPASSQERGKCSRCGRDSHYDTTCFAQTDNHGQRLVPKRSRSSNNAEEGRRRRRRRGGEGGEGGGKKNDNECGK